MPGNPLLEIQRYRQSIWYDFIRRSLLASGKLQHLIDQDGVCGITSNPAIFEKAIAGSPDYDDHIGDIQRGGDLPAEAIYEHLAIEDIRRAADLLAPLHKSTGGRDGYVSLEVSPYLADETEPTLAEARRLWAVVDRPNLMIKVPATAAGLPAIRRLISEGVNINATLLFSQKVYEAVADAYMGGLEQLAAAGKDISGVGSVASFFVSRIDTLVDSLINERMASATQEERRALGGLLGKVAIANAKLAYVTYRQIVTSERWQVLATRGAQTQRLLWASTSTKNPDYPRSIYVDELIGPDTVNTVPAETLAWFRDHGHARPSLTEGIQQAHDTMARLDELGISLEHVTSQLLQEGVELFAESFDKLLGAIERKRRAVLGARLNHQTHALGNHEVALAATMEEWRRAGNVRRIWNRDAKLWTGRDESQWLGWLHLASEQLAHHDHLSRIAEEARAGAFRHALLLGMGGSSLGPEVLRYTFGKIDGCPELVVLDSTVPAQIRAAEQSVDLARTLCIVSSKSGTTTESTMLKRYFFERMKHVVGPRRAGGHFVAITDPGSPLQRAAEDDGFRRVFPGIATVGGRYSVLSNFGMVPAAIAGVDVKAFLNEGLRMAHSCASSVPPAENPGVMLGAMLGALAQAGRDKVTIVASPGIGTFGLWLEQLIAESTGKGGRGLIPVADETLGPPKVYGDDRVFAYARLSTAPSLEQDELILALEAAGHPVVRIVVGDVIYLGQEFFRWAMATAVAGAILGINPFDQPDVEAAKVATRALTTDYELTGTLARQPALLDDGGIRVFADDRNAAATKLQATRTLDGMLRAHLASLAPGDYFAINAYVAMTPENHERLQAIRHFVRDRWRVATTLGYGPRFLHSTGQLHKGGPKTGVFLQITADDAEDLAIPGQRLTFGILKDAQALGDSQVLAERGRRLLCVRLGPDVARDLARLASALGAAWRPT